MFIDNSLTADKLNGNKFAAF